MTISFDELVLNFKKLGLSKGDVLLVHSSYKSFGGIEGGPQTVIDAIRSILTDEGTLIVPTFNYDFCDGKPFDIKKTPSKMGIISELVRTDSNSKRTFDPDVTSLSEVCSAGLCDTPFLLGTKIMADGQTLASI